ncbi:MAG: hypothetical protein KDA27_27280 [Candidatus Eisenbacteria bacterium]|uniref:MarR family transcriptional regulator n=1 Tax=Eiseniibacteriota bacterium TaxID=2212470 RepID=A0A956NKM1_UNCEI|nr:hypothetical protein [Candidatus Eisenbacteria bacterium]
MKALEERLVDYLTATVGSRPDLGSETTSRSRLLPLFLRERYDLLDLRIFGQGCLLALDQAEGESASPSEYANHAQLLKSILGTPVAIVAERLPAYARNRMVQAGVPFIVPGSQLFLPFMMVDLRERFRSPAPPAGKRFAPTTQCILLYHLLREPISGVSLREVADEVGYSAMNVTRAKDEFVSAGLCHVVRQGRSVVMSFGEKGRELWEEALPRLSSPVRKCHWVRWPKAGHPAIRAGLTALSSRTMIEDDRVPSYALSSEAYRRGRQENSFRSCADPAEADTRLEVWSYDPLVLGNDQGVDPLSLFLSLQDSADERVQQQVEMLIEDVHWA